MSVAAPFKAFGVPIITVPRQSNPISSSSNAIVNMRRLLARLEEQIERLGGVRQDSSDSWQSNSLPIALAHANTSLTGIQSEQGLTADVVEMRSRLQTVTQRYTTWQTSQNNNLTNDSKHVQSHLSTRDYLLKDMDDDSDADSEFEDNSEAVNAILQAQKPLSNIAPELEEEPGVANAGEDQEYDEYEQAATLRRRKGEHVVNEKADEKREDVAAPPTALQSERSVQDSLAAELLRMAGVLKNNSVKFADALENDRKVVEQADEKLQGNLTLMTKTRGRLGEYSRKARGMGCMTLGAVAMVCMSWVVMFMLIRLT